MADAGCEYIVPEGEPDGNGRTLIYHFWMVVGSNGRVTWRGQVSRRLPEDLVMQLPRKEVGPCNLW